MPRARITVVAAYVTAITSILLPVYVIGYPFHLRSLYGSDPTESDAYLGHYDHGDFNDPSLIYWPLEGLLDRSDAADEGMSRLSASIRGGHAYSIATIRRRVAAIENQRR